MTKNEDVQTRSAFHFEVEGRNLFCPAWSGSKTSHDPLEFLAFAARNRHIHVMNLSFKLTLTKSDLVGAAYALLVGYSPAVKIQAPRSTYYQDNDGG